MPKVEKMWYTLREKYRLTYFDKNYCNVDFVMENGR